MVKVIVAQYGSRRRYQIPQLLHVNGMLEYLYTDSCRYSFLGRISFLLGKVGINLPSLLRLQKREPKLPSEKLKTNDKLQMKLYFQRMLRFKTSKIIYTIFEGNSSAYISWGCGNADWIYAMYIENFEFTKYAKKHGVKVIVDIYENPYIFKELAYEVENIKEYKCVAHLKNDFLAHNDLRLKYIDKILSIADEYLIPSLFVAQSLKNNSKCFDESKVNIIPYVSSVSHEVYDNDPIKGRIIWIGNEPIRKGLVYALRAVKKLKRTYPDIDFRVIGPMPKEIRNSNDFNVLNFVGYCNKEQLKEEFRKADMLVFPTLSEGFAGSLLEAAGFGVPIITTHASGFGNDFPGLFVKTKDSDDIVVAITKLMENRELRNDISHKIFDYSKVYDKNFFNDSLINLLNKK